jgi:hypothetical protein
MKAWYCEYKNRVRIHDYFNLMINNFPILTFRRLDFGLSEGRRESSYSLALFGFTKNWWVEYEYANS